MKSKKIIYKEKEYYVSLDNMENSMFVKLFLFEDPNLQIVAKEGIKTLLINKKDICVPVVGWKDFKPRFKLIKLYPGMDFPIGTIFGEAEGWGCLNTEDGHGNTSWVEEYFTPWVGEFFEKIT